MKSPGQSFAILSAFALGVSGAKSAGVAALKEQTYHRDLTAKAVVYTRIIDSHGPFLRLVSGSKNVDILRSNLVGQVEVADGIPDSIMEEEDIAPLREKLTVLRQFSTRYPRSAGLLVQQTTALSFHINRFEVGQIRFEGAWISRSEHAEILAFRKQADEARELAEIERRAFDGIQRDKGLQLHEGKWMTRREIEQLPPALRTALSDAIEPLWNGDLDAARFAVKNLGDLAAQQTGAPKVRTERLQSVVRNLFLAESRLTRRIIASNRDGYEASREDKNAKDWLKPNGFGTVTEDAAKESREKAREIRQRSEDALKQRRQELLDQLGETEVVAADFQKLREQRVAMILYGTVRSVSYRNFPDR